MTKKLALDIRLIGVYNSVIWSAPTMSYLGPLEYVPFQQLPAAYLIKLLPLMLPPPQHIQPLHCL